MEREQHEDLVPTVDERAELETGYGQESADDAGGDADSEAEDDKIVD